ncbi:CvpA family protein [Streptococcus vestibularis]|uniref:Colicin V production protein n=1 Tax=Streptococcus vestibularis TaxID=1343 RepID=A0A564SRD0_STRVE|nr:CvpA family protein [Streptococcus vestibularis]VUW97705.1 Colicin V production protein [Streptococcus vestibularis]
MIGLLVLAIMAWNFYIGYRRGLFMQAYYVVSVIIAMCVAAYFYKSLGEAVNLWVPYANPTKDASVAFFTDQNVFSLDRVYYAGVSYFAIYCVTYYGLRFLGIFFHFVRIERLDQTRFQVASGVLASLVSLIPLTMLGNILATVPINNIQTVLSSSWFVRFLINWNFPVSQIIQHLWISVI